MRHRPETMIRYCGLVARRIADLELWIVLLGVAPILLFDAWVPRWAVMAALATVPLLWLIRWLGEGSPVRASPLNLPVLILLVMAPVGVWAAAGKTLSLPHLYRIVLGVALLNSATGTLNSARRLRLMAALLVIAVPALALFALLGTHMSAFKFPELSVLYNWIPSAIRPFWRPAGLGPNSVAGALALLLPLSLGFALNGSRGWQRIASALGFVFAGSVLLLTGSRGALFGLALAVLVMFVVWNRWFLLTVPALIVAGIAAWAAWGIEWLGVFLMSTTATSAVESLEGRLEIWARALYMIQDFPLTGIGLGMFDQILDLLYPLSTVALETDIYHPHNLFLSQAVSGGLPGLIGLLALVCLLLTMGVQSTRWSRGREMWPLALGLLGSVVAHLGHGLFDSPTSFIRGSAILWLLFGVQTALWLHLHGARFLRAPTGGHSGSVTRDGSSPVPRKGRGNGRPRQR